MREVSKITEKEEFLEIYYDSNKATVTVTTWKVSLTEVILNKNKQLKVVEQLIL